MRAQSTQVQTANQSAMSQVEGVKCDLFCHTKECGAELFYFIEAASTASKNKFGAVSTNVSFKSN